MSPDMGRDTMSRGVWGRWGLRNVSHATRKIDAQQRRGLRACCHAAECAGMRQVG